MSTQELPGGFVLTHYYDLVMDENRFLLSKNGKRVSWITHAAENPDTYLEMAKAILEKELQNGQHRGTTAEIRGAAHAAPAAAHAGLSLAGLARSLAGLLPGQGASITNAIAAQAASSVVLAGLKASSQAVDPLGLLIPRKPLPRSEPKCGEIVGHRAWFVRRGVPQLYSCGVYPLAWQPGEPMQDSTQKGEHIDDYGKAGVWGFKTPYDLAGEFLTPGGSGNGYMPLRASQHGLTLIVGTSWHWGTTIEHENGYRSQYGAVRSLDCAYAQRVRENAEGFNADFYKMDEASTSDFLPALRQHYGVEASNVAL